MQLMMGEVATMLGVPCGAPERLVRSYSLDSRTITPGQLFFALRGPRFDGHEFVSQALERGAAGAVVQAAFWEQAAPAIRPALLPVPDTLQALQALALAVRRKWDRRLIAVTGSVGKSTTKEMVAALLARRFTVLRSLGNLNNDYGVPMTLLELEPGDDVAVLELAMSAAGEIARLAQIAEPEVGVVTNVAPVHLQFFDSVDSIARAKRELIEHLAWRRGPPTAILNYDDERIRKFGDGFAGRVLTFGFEQGAMFRAVEVRPSESGGTAFRVLGPNLDAAFRLPLAGRHNVQNALAALAVASLFDIPGEELGQALAAFRNLHQRGEILTVPGEVTVINDSYNSNPRAMECMLEVLAAFPGAQRRILVAGEMLELGPSSPALHRETGRKCAASKVTWLIAVQGDAQFFLEGAQAGGMPRDQLRFFPEARQAGDFCRTLLQPGDVVLVKGSRAVRLESVIELLGASPVGALAGPARDSNSRR